MTDVFDALSPTSRYQRYHTGTGRLRPAALRALTDLHPERHQAFVAAEHGRAVGVARWVRLRSDHRAAEAAMEVVDHAQGRGVGRALASEIARSARRAGIERLHLHVLPGNSMACAWARRLGAVIAPDDSDQMVLQLHSVSTTSTAKGLR